MNSRTSSSDATTAAGRSRKLFNIWRRLRKFPTATSPITKGCAKIWPADKSNDTVALSRRRCSIQIEESTRITESVDAEQAEAGVLYHRAAPIDARLHARPTLLAPRGRAQSSPSVLYIPAPWQAARRQWQLWFASDQLRCIKYSITRCKNPCRSRMDIYGELRHMRRWH
jgi:hypothetical protein